MAYMQFGLVRG